MAWYGIRGKEEETPEEERRLNSLQERQNRWHERQLSLSTFIINLLFTISIAGIGFILNSSANSALQRFRDCDPEMFQISVWCLFASLTFGLVALLLRLHDFRLTKNLVKWRRLNYRIRNKLKYQAKEPIEIDDSHRKIESLKHTTEVLGSLTWLFFYLQIFTLLSSILGFTNGLL